MKRHNGFSMLEILMVIVIISILAGVGTHQTKNIKRANIDQTTVTLRLFASDFESATLDIGLPTWQVDEADIETRVENYLHELESVYFACSWDYTTLKVQGFDAEHYGFVVETTPEKDAWGGAFQFYYVVKDGEMDRVYFASSGPDSTWSDDANTAYQNSEYSDDIVIQIKRR